MNILSDTLYKIRNQKMRVCILSIMYSILLSVILLLLVFSNSLRKQSEFVETYVENEVTVMTRGKPIFKDVAQEVTRQECVKEYNVLSIGSMRLRNCRPYIEDENSYNLYLDRKINKQGFALEDLAQVRVLETNSTRNNVFFIHKGFKLIKGRHIKEEEKNVALISKKFAETNHLKIGDVVETQPCIKDAYYGAAYNMELKIVGIYTHNEENFTGYPESSTSNFIFTSIGPVSNTYQPNYERLTVYLKHGRTLDDLKKEVAENSLYVNVNDYSFQNNSEWAAIIADPLKNMEDMNNGLLLFVLICIVIIVLLIGSFYFRENMHTVGILLSMGEKRIKIILRIVCEGCISLMLGALFATIICYGVIGNVAKIVDNKYTQEVRAVMDEKNTSLLISSDVSAKDSLIELRTAGQKMRIDSGYEISYKLNIPILIIFVLIVGVFFPLCLAIQIQTILRYFSVKQILLG